MDASFFHCPVPPRLFVNKRYEDEITVKADEQMNLEVEYEGYPPCTVSWLIEEEEIVQVLRINFNLTPASFIDGKVTPSNKSFFLPYLLTYRFFDNFFYLHIRFNVRIYI